MFGPSDGPNDTIPGSNTVIDGALNSLRTEGPDLKKINFRDEASRPNFPPPGGFNWEFLEGGWTLRPNVS